MLHLVKPIKGFGADIPARAALDDEAKRLAILKRYKILDSPPEVAFDRIAALAADIFSAPIALISFRDRNRLWFKSHHGFEVTEICWDNGAATSIIEQRLRRELELGFFVSVPLYTYDGYELATLCVIDRQSHQIDERQMCHLRSLAAMAMDWLELRLSPLRAGAGGGQPTTREIDSSALIGRRQTAKNLVASLTPRQREIMELVLAGQRSKSIAAHLGISQRTVENHRATIMKKTDSKSLSALTRLALIAAGSEASVLSIIAPRRSS